MHKYFYPLLLAFLLVASAARAELTAENCVGFPPDRPGEHRLLTVQEQALMDETLKASGGLMPVDDVMKVLQARRKDCIKFNDPDMYRKMLDLRAYAARGDVEAEASLGDKIASHEFPAEGGETALAWFQKAADGGSANGQERLGFIYYEGDGAPRDMTRAIAWFTKAAAQGHANAAVTLARIYARGEDGVAQSYDEAAFWYIIAGDKDGLSDMVKHLSTLQTIGVNKRAGAWKAQNTKP